MDADNRIPVALIPARQPLAVVGALLKLLGVVLGDGAVMAPGNDRDVASTLLAADTDPWMLATRLLAAAQRLGAELDEGERDAVAALPTPEEDAEDAAAVDAAEGDERVPYVRRTEPGLTIGHQRAAEGGGVDVTFGIDEGEQAAMLAHQVLTAFMPLAKRMGVENYLEYKGFDRNTGQMAVLTFQVPGGKTPAELRTAAEAKIVEYKELLDYLELHVNWRWLSGQLTTEQKNLWADAVDEISEREHPGEGRRADRWWL